MLPRLKTQLFNCLIDYSSEANESFKNRGKKVKN